MAGGLTASIKLTVQSDAEAKVDQITARLKALETASKQSGKVGEQASRKYEMELGKLARAQRDVAKAERQSKLASDAMAQSAVRAAQSVKAEGIQAKIAAAKVRMLSRESKNAGRNAGMMINTFGEAAFSIGSVVPQFRQMGMMAAMAGGSAVTMGGALGGVGVVAALLLQGIPALISLFSDTGNAADEAAAATERAKTALERHLEVLDQMATVRGRHDRARRLERGEEDVAAQENNLSVARQTLDAAQRSLTAVQAPLLANVHERFRPQVQELLDRGELTSENIAAIRAPGDRRSAITGERIQERIPDLAAANVVRAGRELPRASAFRQTQVTQAQRGFDLAQTGLGRAQARVARERQVQGRRDDSRALSDAASSRRARISQIDQDLASRIDAISDPNSGRGARRRETQARALNRRGALTDGSAERLLGNGAGALVTERATLQAESLAIQREIRDATRAAAERGPVQVVINQLPNGTIEVETEERLGGPD